MERFDDYFDSARHVVKVILIVIACLLGVPIVFSILDYLLSWAL